MVVRRHVGQRQVLHELLLAPAAPVAALVEAVVGGDAPDPRQHVVAPLQPLPLAEQLAEHFLRRVAGRLALAKQAKAPPVYGGAVLLVERRDAFLHLWRGTPHAH